MATEWEDCDDGDPTTLDTCYPAKGCVHTPGSAGPDIAFNLLQKSLRHSSIFMEEPS